jgi:hypothetical protein
VSEVEWKCLGCGDINPRFRRRCDRCKALKPSPEHYARAKRLNKTPECSECRPEKPCLTHSGLPEGLYLSQYGGNPKLNDPGSYSAPVHYAQTGETPPPAKEHYGVGYVPPVLDPAQAALAALRDPNEPAATLVTYQGASYSPPEPDPFQAQLAELRAKAPPPEPEAGPAIANRAPLVGARWQVPEVDPTQEMLLQKRLSAKEAPPPVPQAKWAPPEIDPVQKDLLAKRQAAPPPRPELPPARPYNPTAAVQSVPYSTAWAPPPMVGTPRAYEPTLMNPSQVPLSTTYSPPDVDPFQARLAQLRKEAAERPTVRDLGEDE